MYLSYYAVPSPLDRAIGVCNSFFFKHYCNPYNCLDGSVSLQGKLCLSTVHISSELIVYYILENINTISIHTVSIRVIPSMYGPVVKCILSDIFQNFHLAAQSTN